MVGVSLLVVIPARFQSTRFPGKPLAILDGSPLIEHVWRRCCQAVDAADIVIATDDNRIAEVALEFGAAVEMTSSACLTGTDRVAEVANRRNADWYINVQGDEPFVRPAAIRTVIDATRSVPNKVAAINTMTVILEEADFRSESVPKPVTDIHGRLLYISRAAIPTDKRLRFHAAYRQIGLYAFRFSALQSYQPGAEKTPLENVEDIEILRLLENGHQIQMVEVPSGGPAVDTPEDLQKAKVYLRSRKNRYPLSSD